MQEALEQVLELTADGQYQDALVQLDALIAAEPEAARLHALRAYVLLSNDRPVEARESARHARALDGGDPYVLVASAETSLALSEPAEAVEAAREAREAGADEDETILLEARARMLLGQWDQAVSRLDYVLSGDETNESAATLRAIALEARGKGAAAPNSDLWHDLSHRFPLNAIARSGHAWNLLRAGRHSDAREEFRQALALDGSSTWAREGLVLALKARYPGYGLLLRYFLWMHQLAPRTRTLLVIGGVLGYNFLRRTAADNPALQPFIIPILVAYIGFVLASWLADPLLNLLLLMHPEGRTVLGDDDREGALRVGACLAGALVLAAIGTLTPFDAAFPAAIVVGLTSITVAGAYNCPAGRYRTRLLRAAGAFVAMGLTSLVVGDSTGGLLIGVAVLGIIISTWTSRAWSERSYAST